MRRHKKTELSRMTSNAKKLRYMRSCESYEQRQDRLLVERLRKKVKKERKSLISSLINNPDIQLNGNMIPPNIVEVNVQESFSDKEDLEQNEDEIKKQTNGDVDEKPKLKYVCESCGEERSEDKSEGICCFRKDVKIEIMLEPLDGQVEEEESLGDT